MSCIIGLKMGGIVWIAADSMLSTQYEHFIPGGREKIFFSHNFVDNDGYKIPMGSVGEVRYQDILEFNEFFDISKTNIDREYMVKTISPKIQSLFSLESIKQDGSKRGTDILIGIRNKLFLITEDYSVIEFNEKEGENYAFYAIGCGSMAANASLRTSLSMLSEFKDPKFHLIEALRSAQEFIPGVHAPFTILNTFGYHTTISE